MQALYFFIGALIGFVVATLAFLTLAFVYRKEIMAFAARLETKFDNVVTAVKK